MNSLDPWRTIVTDLDGGILVPEGTFGHPFYRDVPSWAHCDAGGGPRRYLFEGAFIGADVPGPAKRRGLTAEVGPVLAPGSGGVSFKKELDSQQVLHVEISVDGKSYRTQIDLAPVISMLMDKLAQWHHQQHAQDAAPTLVSSVESIVGQATNTLVDELIGCHCDTICGSFLGDLSNAVKGAAHGVASAAGKLGSGVRSTLRKLKGPIAVAAATAAAGAAMAIPGVGPIAAPIAGKLANDLVQAAAGDAHAKQQVAQAQQQAKSDPTVALALGVATKAVANATVEHHVADTATKAAQGNTAAQQQLAQVATDAQQGDPAAKAVADLITKALSLAAAPATPAAPATTAGWLDVVGASPIDGARARAHALAVGKSANAVGVIHSKLDGHWHTFVFDSLDDAIDWLQRVTYDKTSFTYAAVYEMSDGVPFAQAEEVGHAPHHAPHEQLIRRDVATIHGWG